MTMDVFREELGTLSGTRSLGRGLCFRTDGLRLIPRPIDWRGSNLRAWLCSWILRWYVWRYCTIRSISWFKSGSDMKISHDTSLDSQSIHWYQTHPMLRIIHIVCWKLLRRLIRNSSESRKKRLKKWEPYGKTGITFFDKKAMLQYWCWPVLYGIYERRTNLSRETKY